MHAWSDQSSVHPHGSRLSSSLPPQSRMNRQSASSFIRARYFDQSVDESIPARRTATSRQLNGIHTSFPLNHRRATSAGDGSTLISQPVIVRTYSTGLDAESRRQSVMSGRSNTASNPPVPLPPVDDFGIEGILRAIEPDIRSTIDAIAEICGRSKLSLANDHGSHLPPLGEIRAPSNALLTVEEASSSTERLAGENVLVVGDDISTLDGREHYSTFRLLGAIQSNTGAMGYRAGMAPSSDENATSQQRSHPHSANLAQDEAPLPSATRKRPSTTSNPHIWALVGRETEPGTQPQRQNIQTQPVISEVHLDVEADHHQGDAYVHMASNDPFNLEGSEVNRSMLKTVTQRMSLLSDLQRWLEWFKNIGHSSPSTDGGKPSRSAEMKLKAVLERHEMQLNIPRPAIHA